MAKTTITTTGITSTTTTTTTSTTTTTKKSRLAEFYAQQLADYKKTYERNRKSAKAPATTTATETTTTGTLPAETIATEVPVETATEITPTTAPAETPAEIAPLQEMQTAYNAAVDFCVELDAEEFCELIRWAQTHHNKFPSYVAELKNMINADDVYKDAINKICKPLGEEVTRKAIKMVDSKKILDLGEYLKHVKVIAEEWGEV